MKSRVPRAAAALACLLCFASGAASKPHLRIKEHLLSRAVQALPANKTAAALNAAAAAVGLKATLLNGTADSSVWEKHVSPPLAALLHHAADGAEWKAEELAGLAKVFFATANPPTYPTPPDGSIQGTPWDTELVDETSLDAADVASLPPEETRVLIRNQRRPPLPQNPPGTKIVWGGEDWQIVATRKKNNLEAVQRFDGVPYPLAPNTLAPEQEARAAVLQDRKGLTRVAALAAVAATPNLSVKAAYLWYLLHVDLANQAIDTNPLVVPDVPPTDFIFPPADTDGDAAAADAAAAPKAVPAVTVTKGNAAHPPPSGGGISTPPDGALAVGGGYSVQANNVMITYRNVTTGSVLTYLPLSSIMGSTTPDYGDPRVMWDAYNLRFFVCSYATVGLSSWTYIATSKTSNPRNGWYVFKLSNNVTSWTGCGASTPCFGDYPMMGQDKNSVWITTNQFAQSSGGSSLSWAGTGVWSLGKTALLRGAATVPTYKWFLGSGVFTLQPSKQSETGKVHFLSTYSSSYLSYAYATGTARLNTSPPSSPTLNGLKQIATKLNLAVPPTITEANGDQLRGVGNRVLGLTQPGEKPTANQKLYATANCACNQGGVSKACIAYFIITPTSTGTASVTYRGAIGATGRHTFVGAMAAHPSSGAAGIACTTTGSTSVPFASCFYRINGTTGTVNQGYVVAKSAYLYDFVTPTRSGDYNDAVVTSAGKFYGQAEFGVNGTSSSLPYTNWGTWILSTQL